MRTLGIFGLVLAIATTQPALAQEQAADPVVEEVRALIENYSTLLQAGDLETAGDFWYDGRGVHIIEGAGVNHGWADYRDHHLAPELEEFENFSYRYFAVEPQVRGDVAWSAFRYELSVDTPRGHVEVEGRGTAVLEKHDGKWLFVHFHTSGRPKQES